jgi:outer membrane cobalamin receptor
MKYRGRLYRPLVMAMAVVPLALSGASAEVGEHVVVTATRIPGAVGDTDPNVTVIDAQQIAARHPSSIVELLRTLPGVNVQQAGGRGSVVSIFTRGAKPNFTLVLIDGVKVNDPTNTRGGSFDFSTLALDDIERVELVRGPASTIYGSDAVGGVINFITRRASRDFEADLDASGGSYGFGQVSGHVGGSLGNVAVRAGASYTDNGTPVPGSMLHNTTVDGAISTDLFDDVSFLLTGRYSVSQAQSFPDSSGGPLLAVLRTVDRRNIDEAIVGAHLLYANGTRWSMALDYGLYDRSAEAMSPGVAPSVQTPTGIPPNSDDVLFIRNTVTATARYASGDGFDAAFGVDLQLEHGVDDGTLDFGGFVLPTHFALDRTTWAGFAQAGYSVTSALQLSAGARYDAPDGGGGHFSPQAGATYDIAVTGTRLNLTWGRAFKLPSFYALGNPIVGDPTLHSESATNFAAGLTQPFAEGLLKFDGYDTHYDNLIDFRPGAIPKLVNLSKVHIQGAEVSAEIHLGDDLILTPSFSFNDARNEATGAALRDVPHWLASGVVQWTPVPAVTLSATLLHVGAFTDNSVPTGDVRLLAHQRVDVGATWRVTEQWTLYAAAENILNAHYQDAVGFPAPGTVLRAGIAVLR